MFEVKAILPGAQPNQHRPRAERHEPGHQHHAPPALASREA
jgi:hypothetical protein